MKFIVAEHGRYGSDSLLCERLNAECGIYLVGVNRVMCMYSGTSLIAHTIGTKIIVLISEVSLFQGKNNMCVFI